MGAKSARRFSNYPLVRMLILLGTSLLTISGWTQSITTVDQPIAEVRQNNSSNTICNLESNTIPKNCQRFSSNCSVLQTCIINDNLINEDIPNAQLRDSIFVRAEGVSESNKIVSATPDSPVTVVNKDNPLVSESCRQDVQANVIGNFAIKKNISQTLAKRRLQRHLNKIRAEWAAKGWQKLSPSDVFSHIAECDDLCGPMLAQLSQCHIWAVAQSPAKTLLTFEVDKYSWSKVTAVYPTSLPELAASAIGNDTHRVAIIGRASRDGPADHNLILSLRRANTIRNRLIGMGIAPEYITLVWLGEQTPQIQGPIIERYGLTELYNELGANRKLAVNRSVMAVVYKATDTEHHDAVSLHNTDF